MTINEEKINISNSQDFLTFQDNELLVSLLHEYSDKLILLCDKFEEKRKKDSLLRFLIPLIGGLLFLTSVIVFYNIKNFLIMLFACICIGIAFVVYTNYAYNFIQKDRKHLRLLKREARSIFLRLEKIVRTTSQVQEHSGLSLFNKLALDLRLSDAESALSYYQEMINQ